jgi:large subunit ribosomal protein L4
MQRNIVDMAGNVLRPIELDDRVFGITPNQAVVHQAVVAQQANARQGTHDTKTRAEVAGGGKKPYRQKGTGNARQGSTRAPHYRTGGVVFGPHPRDHGLAMPRKMRRLALRSVLSARAAEEALTVVENFLLAEGRTRQLLSALATLELGEQTLIVLGERSDPVLRAARNLPTVHVVTPNGLNLLDLLRLPRLVLDAAAVETLTRTLTSDLPSAPSDASAPTPSAGPARSTRARSERGAAAEVPASVAGATGAREAAPGPAVSTEQPSQPVSAAAAASSAAGQSPAAAEPASSATTSSASEAAPQPGASAAGAAGQPSPAIASEVAAVPAPATEAEAPSATTAAEPPLPQATPTDEAALPPSATEGELALPAEEEYAPETGAPIEAVDVDQPTEPTEEGSR